MNKQIAEKLGWVSDVIAYSDNGESVWKLPDGRIVRKADFTHSMDACVTYIVPWLVENKGIIDIMFSYYRDDLVLCSIGHIASAKGRTEALALCKAFMEV